MYLNFTECLSFWNMFVSSRTFDQCLGPEVPFFISMQIRQDHKQGNPF
jgi:hypothetical protein